MAEAETITFRDASESDVATIIAMYVDDELGAARDTVSDEVAPGYLAAFREIEARPGTRLIVGETVAEIDGKLQREIVLTMQLDVIPGLTYGGSRRMQVEAVRVASPRRGQGIGRIAMEWAIAEARRQNCVLVQLTSNAARKRAHKFYERLGFVQSHVGMKLFLKEPQA